MISISSRPNSPPSPACGLRPLTAIFRRGNPDAFERDVGGADGARHILLCNQRNRVADAAMQRAMRDALVAEAQHHVDAAFVRPGLPRDERRMAVEFDAGLRDRGFVLRRRHHGIDVAVHRHLHRGRAKRNRRAACDRRGDAETERSGFGLRAGQDLDIGLEPAGLGVALQQRGIAHDHRIASRAHGGIKRGLETDLRADAGRIAHGDRDFDPAAHLYSHGISEAWITSGTPSPPTALIALSTSFRPKRCVVTSSSGNRFDASCSSASSQAR